MPTIKLGARPKSFARNVKTTDVDGTELLIPVTFKYRTRKEYGAWIDSLPPEPTTLDARIAAVFDDKGAEIEPEKFSAEKYVDLISDYKALKLLQCIESWGLDVAFDRNAVKQLCDESPGAADAVLDEYKVASIEGRLGN
jgi:hypothetical protein